MSKQTYIHTDRRGFAEANCAEISITPILNAGGEIYHHDVTVRDLANGRRSFNGVLNISACRPTTELVEVARRDYPNMNIVVLDPITAATLSADEMDAVDDRVG